MQNILNKRNWETLKATFERERLMSVSTFAVMTLTFLIFGIFIGLIAITQTGINYLENQAQLTIFFKDDFPEENILQLKSQFESDARVSTVTYISKEEAFRIFSEINKDEPILLESISANILPASLEVRTENLRDLSVLAQEYNQLDGVEEIKFFEDVIESFRYWSSVIYIVGFTLLTVFLIISFAIIIATLRAVIDSKGIELEILKLVGATDRYVKSPLLFQGMFFGTVSATAAAFVLFLIFLGVRTLSLFGKELLYITVIPGMEIGPWIFILLLVVLLISSGALVGYLSSWAAVRKYLKY